MALLGHDIFSPKSFDRQVSFTVSDACSVAAPPLDQRRPVSSVKKEALGEHLAHSPKNLRNSRVCVPEPLYPRRPAREFRATPRQAIFDRLGTHLIFLSEQDRSDARDFYLLKASLGCPSHRFDRTSANPPE